MTDRALQKARRRELITFLAVAIPVSWIVLSLLSLPLLADDLQDPRLLLAGRSSRRSRSGPGSQRSRRWQPRCLRWASASPGACCSLHV